MKYLSNRITILEVKGIRFLSNHGDIQLVGDLLSPQRLRQSEQKSTKVQTSYDSLPPKKVILMKFTQAHV